LILNILPSSKSNVPEPELDCGVVAVAPKATAYSKCLKKKTITTCNEIVFKLFPQFLIF
jgi:hypothetical protein